MAFGRKKDDKKDVAKDVKNVKEAKIVSNLSLEEQLAIKRSELKIAKIGLGSTLQNPHHIKALKKEIARIMTQINAKATTEAEAEEDATKGDK